MKKWMMLFSVLLIVNVSSLAVAAEDMPATEPVENVMMAMEAPAAEITPEQQEMMAKWQEFSTPNENHQVLNSLVGEWDHEMKFWMDPNKEPEITTGTTSVSWVMGGRFVEQKVSGTSMGQPFEGAGLIGYDNLKKKYVGVWYDNMSTAIMSSTATYDAATKTFNEEGVMSCPMEGGDKHIRAVTKIIDDNSYSYEMYSNDKEGKEALMMQITYTRK